MSYAHQKDSMRWSDLAIAFLAPKSSISISRLYCSCAFCSPSIHSTILLTPWKNSIKVTLPIKILKKYFTSIFIIYNYLYSWWILLRIGKKWWGFRGLFSWSLSSSTLPSRSVAFLTPLWLLILSMAPCRRWNPTQKILWNIVNFFHPLQWTHMIRNIGIPWWLIVKFFFHYDQDNWREEGLWPNFLRQ